jgi:hypothetical protein
VKRLAGKPFVLLGVNSDSDREALKKIMLKEGITWRSWWDGGSTSGPIAMTWNINTWPTFFVLDAQGVIRYKSEGAATGETLDKWIDELVAEEERKKEARR